MRTKTPRGAVPCAPHCSVTPSRRHCCLCTTLKMWPTEPEIWPFTEKFRPLLLCTIHMVGRGCRARERSQRSPTAHFDAQLCFWGETPAQRFEPTMAGTWLQHAPRPSVVDGMSTEPSWGLPPTAPQVATSNRRWQDTPVTCESTPGIHLGVSSLIAFMHHIRSLRHADMSSLVTQEAPRGSQWCPAPYLPAQTPHPSLLRCPCSASTQETASGSCA